MDFRGLVKTEFGWLRAHGYRLEAIADYGLLGFAATLTDDHHWLRVSWETREDAVLLSWGDYLAAGRINDDPYRNPRPLEELLPELSRAAIAEVGKCGGDSSESVALALGRVSRVIRDSSRYLYTETTDRAAERLPGTIKTKIVSFGEYKYGASRVALVMSDGTIIEDVIVAWGDEVVRVGGVDVSSFDTSQVVDALDRN
jgi:hypothetical protein